MSPVFATGMLSYPILPTTRDAFGSSRPSGLGPIRRYRPFNSRGIRPVTFRSKAVISFFTGAKAPLKSGGAPKGYEVKGNADSGLFHEPDGQWYDQTVAEFYFKTAEDAEAAGFTRADGEGDK